VVHDKGGLDAEYFSVGQGVEGQRGRDDLGLYPGLDQLVDELLIIEGRDVLFLAEATFEEHSLHLAS
jgi:hypothetical protein